MQDGKRMPTILVVDDDPHISELVGLYLAREGFQVKQVFTGPAALSALAEEPALVILDIMLPGLDGWQVCREIRRRGQTPVIMLSAKGQASDRILGLELGADDYMVKPFEAQELVARVRAVLRRLSGGRARDRRAVLPGLVVDMNEYTVCAGEERVDLLPREIELLYFLASHPNQVFTREQLLEHVWGEDFLGETRTVDVHVQRLRAKLPDPGERWGIKTVWGIGYKLEVK